MLYDAYEVQRSLLSGASKLAGLGAGWLSNPSNPFGYSSMGPLVAAGLEVFAHASAPRGKPEFGIGKVLVGKKLVQVDEDIAIRKPFGQLKRFRKVDCDQGEPLLIVAPIYFLLQAVTPGTTATPDWSSGARPRRGTNDARPFSVT